MPADLDQQFADAGLLDGLEDGAREARLALLRQLHDDGVSLEELRAAVREDRLPFLPIDRALSGEARYTPREVAEKAGVPLEYLERVRRAAGLAVPDPDERALDENAPRGGANQRRDALGRLPGGRAAGDHPSARPRDVAGGCGDPVGRRAERSWSRA